MADWKDQYLTESERKYAQVSTKNIRARQRRAKQMAETAKNAQSISKAGYVSPAARQKYNDTKARIAEQFEATKKKAKEMPSWERKRVIQNAQDKKSKITNR